MEAHKDRDPFLREIFEKNVRERKQRIIKEIADLQAKFDYDKRNLMDGLNDVDELIAEYEVNNLIGVLAEKYHLLLKYASKTD